MTVSAYTGARARALSKLNIPALEAPIPIRFLWVDALVSTDFDSRVYTGSSLHTHTFYELHFVFGGSISYEWQGQAHTLTAGDALFIPPSFPHRYLSHSEDILKVSTAFSFPNTRSIALSLPTDAPHLFRPAASIAENADFILRQIDRKDLLTPTIIGGRLLEILYTVFESIKIRLPEGHMQTADARLPVATRYIEENRHRLITCEDVAAECCLSVKQLSRIFKNETGSTLFEAIVAAKLRYAQKLLLQSEHSVKEIGYLLGFENEYSFVSFFKRHMGMPAGAYRKQNLHSEKQERQK